MSTAEFFLREHVHACVANQYLVFLDLHRNRYACIDRPSTRAIEGRLCGLRLAGAAAKTATRFESRADACNVLRSLVEQGLITTEPAAGGAVVQSVALPQHEAPHNSQLRLGSMLRYTTSIFLAAHTAADKLDRVPIQAIIESIRTRRMIREETSAAMSSERARRLAAAFRNIRRFVARPPACLFDSLALLEFMARHGGMPSLVFGVKMDPFAAHCWVQHDTLLLNDTTENVALYSPILAV